MEHLGRGVVEGELLAAVDVALGEEGQTRHVRVHAVGPHGVHGQVRVALPKKPQKPSKTQ